LTTSYGAQIGSTGCRSVVLDAWNEEQLDTMQRCGNAKVASFFELRGFDPHSDDVEEKYTTDFASELKQAVSSKVHPFAAQSTPRDVQEDSWGESWGAISEPAHAGNWQATAPMGSDADEWDQVDPSTEAGVAGCLATYAAGITPVMQNMGAVAGEMTSSVWNSLFASKQVSTKKL
jgi:hypothetical protein